MIKIHGSSGIEFPNNYSIKSDSGDLKFSHDTTTIAKATSEQFKTDSKVVIVHGRGKGGTGSRVSGSFDPIKFTEVDTNISDSWNNSNATFTAPVSGYYKIQMTNGNASSANNNLYIGLYILINDVAKQMGWSRNEGYDRTAHAEIIWYLAVGDTVKFTHHANYAAVPENAIMSSYSIVLIHEI